MQHPAPVPPARRLPQPALPAHPRPAGARGTSPTESTCPLLQCRIRFRCLLARIAIGNGSRTYNTRGAVPRPRNVSRSTTQNGSWMTTTMTKDNGSSHGGLSRRQLMSGLATGAGAAALAACAGPGTGGAGGQKAAGTVNASGTVRYFNWGNAFSDGIEQKVLDAFHKKQDKIKVEFTNSQTDHYIKLSAMVA